MSVMQFYGQRIPKGDKRVSLKLRSLRKAVANYFQFAIAARK